MIILHWKQTTSCGKPSYSLLILYLSYDFFRADPWIQCYKSRDPRHKLWNSPLGV